MLLSALGAALAYPPTDWGWLIGFMPALWFALLYGRRPRAGFGWGWLWGFLFYGMVGYPLTYLLYSQTHHWGLTLVGWLSLAALQAFYPALFGWLATHAPPSPLAAASWLAASWTLLQWLRSLGPLGFLWGHWAVALYRYPLLLQVADLGGAWLVEWLIAFWNASLASLLTRSRPLSLSPLPSSSLRLYTALLLVLLFWLGYGFFGRMRFQRVPDAPRLQVAIAQPNLDLTLDYTPPEWERYRQQLAEMVREAGVRGAKLVVFPESIEPYVLPDSTEVLRFWRALARETGCAILIGGHRVADRSTQSLSNSAHLIEPQGDYQFVDKVQLVLFGEFVPLRDQLGFLARFGVVERDLIPAAEPSLLQASAGARVGVPICMESTYPWIARTMVQRGANLLAVISNESWFGRTAALQQHAAFTVLRAVESRRWILRSAPQGISGVYRADGSFETLPLFTQQLKVVAVPLLTQKSLYVRLGEWVGWACALGLLGLIWLRRRSCLSNYFSFSEGNPPKN